MLVPTRSLTVAALSLCLAVAGLLVPVAGDDAPARAAAAPTGSVRVGTFNIGGVQTDKSAKRDHRRWKTRRAGVASRILGSNLDVVGLQEANPSSVHRRKLVTGTTQYQDLLNALNARGGNYAVTTAEAYNCARATSGTRCSYRNHGSALSNRIFYDRDTVTLLDKGSMRYRAQTRGGYVRYLEWAKFRLNATGRDFLFTNTHLDPNTPANRPKQWREWLKKTAALRGSLPVVSVGDYNTTKFSTWAKRTLPLTRRYGLVDVLNQHFQKNPGRPRAERVVNGWLNSFNGYRRGVKTWSYYRDKRKQGNVIDWIFTSQHLRVTDYEVVAWVDKRRLRAKGTFPSDHNLVRATVVIP